MSIGTEERILSSQGVEIDEKRSLSYLGAVIDGHGRLDSEISCKMGAAKADFKELSKLWNHANVPVKDKLQFFHSLIMSKLICGLSSVWLVTAQRRRLDGFYARCLRRILHIQPSFLSRVSNATVFARASVQPFTEQVQQRQLILLGKVARSLADSPTRRNTFIPDSILPQIGRYVRRVARPRLDWTTELLKVGENRMGRSKLKQLLMDTTEGAQQRWKREVRELFGAPRS